MSPWMREKQGDGGERGNRIGGAQTCGTITSRSPREHDSEAGNGSGVLAQAGLICWLPAAISVTGESAGFVL